MNTEILYPLHSVLLHCTNFCVCHRDLVLECDGAVLNAPMITDCVEILTFGFAVCRLPGSLVDI